MELKDFQQGVLDTFSYYLEKLREEKEKVDKLEQLIREHPELKKLPVPDYTEQAWNDLKSEKRLPKYRALEKPFSPRKDGTGRPVPSVCFKIPTGGGKTLLATHAISRLLNQWQRKNTGFVLWIVPNEAIYTQTLKALRDREHPYRQTLDRAAAGKVKILETKSPLNSRDVDNNLCIMVLMLAAANRNKNIRKSLKVFKENGIIHGFFPYSDDIIAHHRILNAIPNLDVYEDNRLKENLGSIIKDSLGNVLRFVRPLVVMDEGHRGYSRLAMDTLYDLNPSFLLELTATPVDRLKDNPPTYSNWLVDIRGIDMDREEMIKLPINVTVQGGEDWRDCLRKSYECLNNLQKQSEKLRADSARYIRPICLIQVERTGKEQRDGKHVHVEDVKEFLFTLGVSQEDEIAKKTAEENELNQPKNQNLLSVVNQVRFIITKQALQEGWDCPFAYILCSLAPVSSTGSLTQLIGRILRQPGASKTGIQDLDQCYVFCHHTSTRDVVESIKQGLEQEGIDDLAGEIRDQSSTDGTTSETIKVERRAAFRALSIFLPLVLKVEDSSTRQLARIIHKKGSELSKGLWYIVLCENTSHSSGGHCHGYKFSELSSFCKHFE